MEFVGGDGASDMQRKLVIYLSSDTIFVHFAVIDLCARIETLCIAYRDEGFMK